MYYSKKNNFTHDYYNTYTNSAYSYESRRDYLKIILKVLLIILFLGFIFISFLFISKKIAISNELLLIKEHISKVVNEKILDNDNREKELKNITKDTQESKKEKDLTQAEIANIIFMVMQKMDTQKGSSSASDDAYAQELLLQDVDKIENSNIAINNINLKKVAKDKKIDLSKSNHYNKVVINSSKESETDTLSKLSYELNSAINESSSSISNYTQEISKEIAVRSNEMRIIVVNRGDTLSKIAKRAYGNYDDYVKIFEANPEIIKNPDQIYVGQKLRIPI